MSVSIYQYPIPVIELSLVAGGSLLANQTYYFGARYAGSKMGHGALSQQYSITTDEINKSIRVKIKWWNGSSWDYNRPTLSFYADNLSHYRIIWNTADMTDGAGNRVFSSTYATTYINQVTTVTHNVVYSTAPSVNSVNNYYTYIPERWGYGMTAGSYLSNNFGWSLTQGHPIVYATSASDGWVNLINTLKASTSFTNFRLSENNRTIEAYCSIYTASGVTWDDLNITLHFGCFFSGGSHSRCFINTMTAVSGMGATGNGTIITAGNNTYLRGTRYRQSFSINGTDNTITSLGGQMGLGPNENAYRKYVNTFLLTNGLNGSNNFSMYNSLLCDQILASNETISNIYQNTVAAKTSWVYDIVFMNGFNNNPTALTINNYSIDTDRSTSEGINYSLDKKPRIRWEIASGTTYVQKTLILKNSLDLYITDILGTPIANASVILSNGFETLSGTTDVNGYLQKYIKIRTAVQDPTITSGSTYNTIWTDYKNVDLVVSKAGYETYKSSGINLLNTKSVFVALKTAKPTLYDTDGGIYVNLDKENIGSPIVLSV